VEQNPDIGGGRVRVEKGVYWLLTAGRLLSPIVPAH
jgi:hypothetical protein